MEIYPPSITQFKYDLVRKTFSLVVSWRNSNIIINNTINKNLVWYGGKPCFGFKTAFGESEYFVIIYNEKLVEELININESKVIDTEILRDLERMDNQSWVKADISDKFYYSEICIEYNNFQFFFCRTENISESINFIDNGDGSYDPYDFSNVRYFFDNYQNSYLTDILMIVPSIPDVRNDIIDENICEYYFDLKKINSSKNNPFIIKAYKREIKLIEGGSSYIILFNKIYIENNLYVIYTFPTKLLIELNTSSKLCINIDSEELPIPRIPLSRLGEDLQQKEEIHITEIFDRTTLFCILKIQPKYDPGEVFDRIYNPSHILSFLPLYTVSGHRNYRPWDDLLPDYQSFLYRKEQEKQYEEQRREENIDYEQEDWNSLDAEIQMNEDPDRWIDDEIAAYEKSIEESEDEEDQIKYRYSKYNINFINQMVPLVLSDNSLYCVYNKEHDSITYEGQIIYKLSPSPFFPRGTVWNHDIVHPLGFRFQMIIFQTDKRAEVEKLYGSFDNFIVRNYFKYTIAIKQQPKESFFSSEYPRYIYESEDLSDF